MSEVIDNVKLTFDKENEFIEVEDKDVPDGYAISFDNVVSMDENEVGHLVIIARKPESEETAEHVFAVEDDVALGIMEAWSDWYAEKKSKKVETVNMSVQCPNDDENKLRLGELIKGYVEDIQEYEAEKKYLSEQSKAYTEKIKLAHEKLFELKDELNAETVNREKECFIHRDYEQGEVRFIDPETGDVVEKRKMSLEEKQASMEFDEEKGDDDLQPDAEQQARREKYFDAFTSDYFHKFWTDEFNYPILHEIKPHVLKDEKFDELIEEASQEETLTDESGEKFYEICRDHLAVLQDEEVEA